MNEKYKKKDYRKDNSIFNRVVSRGNYFNITISIAEHELDTFESIAKELMVEYENKSNFWKRLIKAGYKQIKGE